MLRLKYTNYLNYGKILSYFDFNMCSQHLHLDWFNVTLIISTAMLHISKGKNMLAF
jgi:hypothetical protein